jgi:dTDP-4-amino-4,6-dideoxygalactose transaminase
VALGFKYNMTELQAALGLVQLARLEAFLDARAHVAACYRAALRNLTEVDMLEPVPYPARHAWHLLVVQLRLERLRIDRDAVMDALLAANIGVGLHFKALHLHPLYRERGLQSDALVHATRASARVMSLPLFPEMTEDDVRDVATALEEIVRRHAA